jgi:hypothetical protein
MDPKDLRLTAAVMVGRKLLKRANKHEMTNQEVIALAEARIRDKLLVRARKHGLTDQYVDGLAEAWKQAAKKTKYLKVGLCAQGQPSSSTGVEL